MAIYGKQGIGKGKEKKNDEGEVKRSADETCFPDQPSFEQPDKKEEKEANKEAGG